MSAKMMGLVYDLDLPRSQKQVLLALADHADHEGRNAYPGVDLLVHKTGYSPRQVQRSLAELAEAGVISADEYAGGGRGKKTVFSLHLEKGDKLAPIKGAAQRVTQRHPKGAEKGDTAAPIGAAKGDIDDTKRVTSCPQKGDIDDSSPFSLYEPSLEPSLEPTPQPPTSGGVRECEYPADFLALWEPYPTVGKLRSSKTQSLTAWQRLSAKTRADVMNALTIALRYPDFVDKFAPALERWLKSGKWEPYLEASGPPPAIAAPRRMPSESLPLEDRAARNADWVR